MRITVDTGPRTPPAEDWKVLLKYLDLQMTEASEPGVLVYLGVSYVPEIDRPEQMAENHLRKEPIWRTYDDSDFVMWLYADGSDSEG